MTASPDLSRRGLLADGAAFVAVATTATGRARAATPPDKPRGQVVAGLSQEPAVFNPLMPANEVDEGVWWQLFSPLWYTDPDGRLVPDLAREVPSVENGGLSADGLTWKVRLRSGVEWHDGEPFTAEDVRYTLDLINNPGFRVRSRVGHSLVRDIRVVAPDEIHWRMESPYAPYLSILSLTFVVPKHVLEAAQDPNTTPFNQAPVGTGPFRWGERVAGDHLQLVASPAYHGTGPYLERVVFKYIPDLTMLYTQFRTGQIDYLGLGGIPAYFVKEAQALTDKRISRAPTPFIEQIALNLGNPSLADKAVRHALYLGMNKQARIEALYYGLPIETESFLPPQSWAYESSLPAHRFDPAAANTLLDGAGWQRGSDGIRQKDGVRLAFTSSTTAGNPGREQAQQLLMQDWKSIGAALRIQNMPAAVVFGEFWQKSKYDTVLVGSNFMLGSDPDVTNRFGSGSIPAAGGQGSNTYQYRNPTVDTLLAEGARGLTRDARRPIYQQIQRQVREDLPFLPVYQSVIAEGLKDNLQGFAPNINCSSSCWNMRAWFWA